MLKLRNKVPSTSFPSQILPTLTVPWRGSLITSGKYNHLFRKTYFGAMWRNSKRSHKLKWKAQDPLYHNEEFEHIQGDMRKIIKEMKLVHSVNEIPLRKIAYFLYHMGQ